MQEYYFPSGIPITGFDGAPYLLALKIFYAVMLVIAIGVFVWRCTCSTRLSDIFGWILFVGMECLLAWQATRYFQASLDRFSPWDVWSPPLLWSLGLGILATLISMFRVENRVWNYVGVTCLCAGFSYALVPSMGHPREAVFRTQCKNHLKQIGLALHNYHDVFNSFPAAGEFTPAEDEDQVWTWRVAILPWLDQPSLFNEFRRDEPWNSPYNSALQPKNPETYRCPSHQRDRKFTAYAMLRGPGTIGGDGRSVVKIKEITDGISNTAFIVEACGRDLIWTEPKDVAATRESRGVNLPGTQPGHSRAMLSSRHALGAHVLLGDGSVRFINEKTDPEMLRRLSTYDDGEVFFDDW